jgi:hypothetical protein
MLMAIADKFTGARDVVWNLKTAKDAGPTKETPAPWAAACPRPRIDSPISPSRPCGPAGENEKFRWLRSWDGRSAQS